MIVSYIEGVVATRPNPLASRRAKSGTAMPFTTIDSASAFILPEPDYGLSCQLSSIVPYPACQSRHHSIHPDNQWMEVI
jgi:hypothetical protein